MADAHRRHFDAVVVWKFDRFARSVSHLLRALETFRAMGIEFVSLSGQVDTSTPTSEMVFPVLGAVADYAERTIMRSHWAEVPFWPARQGFSTSHNNGSSGPTPQAWRVRFRSVKRAAASSGVR